LLACNITGGASAELRPAQTSLKPTPSDNFAWARIDHADRMQSVFPSMHFSSQIVCPPREIHALAFARQAGEIPWIFCCSSPECLTEVFTFGKVALY
jgi:hypothetical protein